MQKKFIGNLFFLLGINLLIKPFWILGIDRAVQNMIGFEAYGVYVNMFSLSLILTMLLDFGINNFNTSTIVKDPSRLNTQFSSLLSLKLILSTVYLLSTIILSVLYGYRGILFLFVMVLAMNQVLAHFSTFVRSNISGLQKYKTDSLLSAVDRLVMIIFGGMMLAGWLFPAKIETFILIQTSGYVVVLIVGLIILSPHLSTIKIRFDKELIVGLLKQTFPYALLAFIMLLYSRLDVLLIKKLLVNGDLENGVYASGARLLEASNMMVGAATGILLPVFASMIANRSDFTSFNKLLVALMLVPVSLFAIGCHTYSHEIMHLLSSHATDYSSNVFSILILCFLPYTLVFIYGSMLTAKGDLHILNKVSSIGLLINVVFNVILIPRYGAFGAAITALITQGFVGIVKMFFALKRVHIKQELTDFAKIAMFIVCCFAGFFLLHYFHVTLFYAFVFMSIIAALWIWFLRMIDKDRVLSLFGSFVRGRKTE